jgi:hypothetical protein
MQRGKQDADGDDDQAAEARQQAMLDQGQIGAYRRTAATSALVATSSWIKSTIALATRSALARSMPASSIACARASCARSRCPP